MISYKISIHKQISFGMHCLSKLNLFHNTSFSMTVNFRLESFSILILVIIIHLSQMAFTRGLLV